MKMKRYSLFLRSLVMLVIFTDMIICVNAINTGFSTKELTDADKKKFVNNINISLLTSEPIKSGILCFDVNEQGMIAVGKKGSQGKEVCVYNTQGEFLYGYAFNCTQSFGVEWDKEYVNIYFVRSDVIISLDSFGNILDIKGVQNTIDNNTHSNSLLYETKRIMGDTTYLIRNDMGMFNWIATTYSKIITVDANGVEYVIYDIGPTQIFKTLAIFLFIIILVSIAVSIVVWQIIKLGKTESNQYDQSGDGTKPLKKSD